ncbi:MAG: universal stress protein [Thermomicrobiales bacterium]
MASTVILPLDRSAVSEQAIPAAKDLASRTGAVLVLVSVIEAPSHLAEWAAARRPDDVVESWTKQQREVSDYLEEVAGRFDGDAVETRTLTGNPARQINQLARHVENPVIVMASHGHSALERLRLGSVASGVVQSALCPVIVVRQGSEGPPVSFDRILVALDGSDFAEEALGAVQAVLGTTGLASSPACGRNRDRHRRRLLVIPI